MATCIRAAATGAEPGRLAAKIASEDRSDVSHCASARVTWSSEADPASRRNGRRSTNAVLESAILARTADAYKGTTLAAATACFLDVDGL
jgi:hypothetical protein